MRRTIAASSPSSGPARYPSCSALNPKKQYCGARSPHHPPPQGRRGTPPRRPSSFPGRTRLNTQTLSKGATIPGTDDRRRTCSIPRNGSSAHQKHATARNPSQSAGARRNRGSDAPPHGECALTSSLVHRHPHLWSQSRAYGQDAAIRAFTLLAKRFLVENQRYEPPRGHLRGRFNARSRTATSLNPRQNSQRPFSTELSRSKPNHEESRRRTWRIRIENRPKRVPHAHRLGAMSGTPEHFLKLSSNKESSPYPESRRRTWRIRIENRPKRVPHAHRLGAMSGTPEHFLKLSSNKESSPYPCMISQLRDLGPMVKENEPARLNLSRVRTNFNWRP